MMTSKDRGSAFAGALIMGVLATVAMAMPAGAQASASQASGSPSPQSPHSWSLAIHGGAGTIERNRMTPAADAAYRAALAKALDAGSAILSSGGSSLDAVQAAVQIMEDDPLFNAGRGAVFTAAGRNELDAAIMDGSDLRAGAVAGLTTTRHPIAAARAVMEQSPHVMLIGAGADTFSATRGLEQVDPAYFFTERRWRGLVDALEAQSLPIPALPEGVAQEAHSPMANRGATLAPLDERKFGTVGAVALDSQGRLAAATSTGGMTAKQWGRVGDVPIIGAGTYASNLEGCAVSATGSGEYFIRSTVARDICRRIADGASVQEAGDAEIADVGSIGGDGGVIIMGRDGTHAYALNTSGMYRGAVSATSAPSVAIYADEP